MEKFFEISNPHQFNKVLLKIPKMQSKLTYFLPKLDFSMARGVKNGNFFLKYLIPITLQGAKVNLKQTNKCLNFF